MPCFRPLLLMLLIAAWPAPGAAQATDWRGGWGLGRQAAPEAGTAAGDGRFAELELAGTPAQRRADVRSLLAGPVQVRLRAAGEAASLPTLPFETLLPAGSRRTLVRLQPAASGRVQLLLDAVPGDPAARPRDHLYQLPFADSRIRIDQAFGGTSSHHDAENGYAVDFALPRGTPVLAARAGTVMQVVDGHPEAGPAPVRGAPANLVRILHEDGSMAVYGHLQAGIVVRQGQRVEAGQHLGASGNSGYSTAPHLHFVVQANAGLRLQSLPFRMLSPRGELRFARPGAFAP